MISFSLFTLYLVLLYLRPVEFLASEGNLRMTGLVGLLALFAALGGRVMGRPTSARLRHFALLGGLIASIGLSVAAAGYVGGALGAVLRFSPAATLFILTVLNVTTKRRLVVTAATMAVCVTLLAIAGIAAFHFGFMEERLLLNQANVGEEEATIENGESDVEPVLRRVRSLGFLNDPNDFAQALVMVLPFLLCFTKPRAWMRNCFVFVLPASLFLYTIYLTRSRGAIVGMGAMILFGGRNRLGTMRTAVLSGILLVGALAANMSGGRGFSVDEESVGSRIDAWSEGLAMLRSNPAFGVGFGNFVEYFDLTAHNSFVLCFAELGLIGYFFWIGLIVASVMDIMPFAGRSTTPSDEFGSRWTNAMLASLVGFLACGWFLSRAYVDTLYLLLGIAISTGYVTRLERQIPAPKHWFIPSATVAMFGSVAVVYLFVRMSR